MYRALLSFIFLCAILFGCDSNETQYNEDFGALCANLPDGYTKQNRDSIIELVEGGFCAIQSPSHLDHYNYYTRQCWFYRQQHSWDMALVYTDSMLGELTPIRSVERQYIYTLNIRGVILRAKRLYDEALKQYYAAKIFTKNSTDTCGSSEVYLNLGTVLYDKENYREAITHYLWVVNLLTKCDSNQFKPYVYNLNSALNALGLCYEKLGNYDTANYFYQRSLAHIRSCEPRFPEEAAYMSASIGVTMGNLGYTQVLRGNFDTAERILKESISQNSDDSHLREDVLFTKIKLVKLYTLKNSFAKAKALIEQIELEGTYTPAVFMRLEAAKHELFDKDGEESRAYGAFKLYNRTRDSIQKSNKELLPLNLTETYTYLSQKEQIRNLVEAEQRRTFYLIVAVISMFALLIIAYLIRSNLVESKRHVEALNSLNGEMLQQHDQLENTLKALEKSHDENKRLMKALAHDLRSPIGGMVSLAELLKDSSRLDEKEASLLSMIEKIGRDSLLMMEDILDLKEVLPTQKKIELDLFDLLSYCTNLMQLRANDKNQKIRLTGVHIHLPLMRDQIWRSVNNILNNAIKFSPQGTTIQVELTKTATSALLSIKDEGIGIPEEYKSKLFSLVSEGMRSGTEGEKTFGLGLPLAKQVMDSHGGKIWFESKVGRGSTFFLEFPCN